MKPSKYTDAQRAFFRSKHADYKGGSLREGTACVLCLVPGSGTCSVGLESIDPATGLMLPGTPASGEDQASIDARAVAAVASADADLAAKLAAGAMADDDADCIRVDALLGRCSWAPPPVRVLRAAVADDRLWAILERARQRHTEQGVQADARS